MSKHELTKTIESRKLHKRTGVPTPEPPVTIPFGAIIEDLVEDRDVGKFTYLGEPYQCPYELLMTAVAVIQLKDTAPPPDTTPSEEPVTAGREGGLRWEPVGSSYGQVMRAKVPGGWLLLMNTKEGTALAFYPDAKHQWGGAAKPQP